MKVKADTRKQYLERINNVINYIDNNLNESLEIGVLASVGNYSEFHLHRIMSAYLGEPLGAYIVRRRLETAVNLLRYSDIFVSDVAFKVGYENPASFNKAFKKRYSISPNEYRKNYNGLINLQVSKIKYYGMENLKSLQPKIKERKPQTVIYAEALGSYINSAQEAWGKVCQYAKEKKLFGFSNEFIGISHSDPKVTEASKLRYDACIAIKKDIKPEGGIGVKELAGGKYAVFTHKGPYENFTNSYDYIYGKWIPDNKIVLRDVPGFEKYINSIDDTKPEKLITEIWIPIK